MSKFLKALAKVGLVDLEESERSRLATPEAAGEEPSQEDINRILADARKTNTPEAASSAPPPPSAQAQAYESGVGEGRELSSIYAEMSVPPSPFPAEKLLKLLDGLRAMDPHTRKAAVLAMD